METFAHTTAKPDPKKEIRVGWLEVKKNGRHAKAAAKVILEVAASDGEVFPNKQTHTWAESVEDLPPLFSKEHTRLSCAGQGKARHSEESYFFPPTFAYFSHFIQVLSFPFSPTLLFSPQLKQAH